MEYCSDFKYDLQVGLLGEKMLAEILNEKKIEVKRDAWAFRSGNIAIEFESRGKPSGIAKTIADYWAFILSGEYKDCFILIIEINKLKEISRAYYKKGSIKQMGDNNTSKSVLVPLKELFNHATL
jgi:hypothetical protein